MSTTLCKIILKCKTISAKAELGEIDFDSGSRVPQSSGTEGGNLNPQWLRGEVEGYFTYNKNINVRMKALAGQCTLSVHGTRLIWVGK